MVFLLIGRDGVGPRQAVEDFDGFLVLLDERGYFIKLPGKLLPEARAIILRADGTNHVLNLSQILPNFSKGCFYG